MGITRTFNGTTQLSLADGIKMIVDYWTDTPHPSFGFSLNGIVLERADLGSREPSNPDRYIGDTMMDIRMLTTLVSIFSSSSVDRVARLLELLKEYRPASYDAAGAVSSWVTAYRNPSPDIYRSLPGARLLGILAGIAMNPNPHALGQSDRDLRIRALAKLREIEHATAGQP